MKTSVDYIARKARKSNQNVNKREIVYKVGDKKIDRHSYDARRSQHPDNRCPSGSKSEDGSYKKGKKQLQITVDIRIVKRSLYGDHF